MKKVLVTGAGGFIAHHLIRQLKKEKIWVRGVDIKEPEFSDTDADEFLRLDLREARNCEKALDLKDGFDEVFHLAADMGGMGFIHSEDCRIMRNSGLINNHMPFFSVKMGVKKFFFSSSVCVYRNMKTDEPEMSEEAAYPAFPDNDYGWEKLFAERALLAYGRKYPMQIRIARFQNCYGPEGAWRGGREKAPAALCRKIAEIKDGGEIEVWGDGSAVRSYTYIDDMVDGICRLMNSSFNDPVNIGNPEYVSVDHLVSVISRTAKKKIRVRYVEGPVGVQSRNFSNAKIYTTGWKPRFNLEAGIQRTYPWIEHQVKLAL